MNSMYDAFTHFIRDLLAPPGDICLTCGAKYRLLREWPGICQRCATAIPWINKPRCFYCGRAIGCPDCVRKEARERSFILNRSAVQYSGMMREWLAQYKYRGHERYAGLMIRMMNRALERMISEMSVLIVEKRHRNPGVKWIPDLITYVPVSETRLMERGFNQAQILAEGLGLMRRIPVSPLLIRHAHTEKQSFKTRQERIESMRDVFGVENNAMENLQRTWEAKHTGKAHQNMPIDILMVDDIYTTGSTIDACSRVLMKEFEIRNIPLQILSLTWARS